MESVSRFCGLPLNGTYHVWDTSLQVFGQCFIWTAVSYTAHAIFLVQAAYYYGVTRQIKARRLNCAVVLLVLLTLLLALSNIAELIISYALTQKHPPAYVLSKSLSFSTWLLWFCLHIKIPVINPIKRRIVKCSLLPFLVVSICSCFQLHYTIKHILVLDHWTFVKLPVTYIGAFINTLLLLLYFVCSIITLFSRSTGILLGSSTSSFNRNLSIQAEDIDESGELKNENSSLLSSGQSQVSFYETYQQRKKEKTNIYLGEAETASWNIISRLFFLWCNKLILKGYHGQLENPDDLFILPSSLDTNLIKERFTNLMRIQRHQTVLQELKRVDINDFSSTRKRPSVKISMFKCLHKTFGKFYYSLGILKFIVDCLGFTGPLLLNALVTFMENKEEPISHGYYYAAALFFSNFLMVLLTVQFNYYVSKVGFQVRAGLITTIYEKTLAVSTSSLGEFSTGQVVNYMSTDTNRVFNFCRTFHQFWSLPFQIAVSLYLLYQQVGISSLAAIGFIFLLVPVNKFLATKIGYFFKRMMVQKDTRVRIINEVLAGIRIIKLYAWEDHFKLKISEARNEELKSLKGGKYLDAMCVYFWGVTPVVISVLTFSMYVLLGHELTAAKVFTSIALFNMLITPLNAFPWVINALIEARISLKRIEGYISLPEINFDNYYVKVSPEENDNTVLEMENASFRWKDKDYFNIEPNSDTTDTTTHRPLGGEYHIVKPFNLKDISLFVEKGQLLGVTGKVGSGKSTLFASITAETDKYRGYIYIGDDFNGFAFVTQEAWIQHMSMRDNILFGQPYDCERYNEIIHACAMSEDLNLLPAGDETEVGENGVTLSGGQKARLSLARAIYQDKEIYILDDPLSAVDSHVANHIMKHCIMGLLKHKTRILGTHHVKYLWQADSVVHLHEGEIVKYGSPQDVLPAIQALTENGKMKNVVKDDENPIVAMEDSQESKASNSSIVKEEPKADGKFISAEKKAKGRVALSVYKSYWKSIGYMVACNVLMFLVLMQASRNLSDWWLSYWISHTQSIHNNTIYHATLDVMAHKLDELSSIRHPSTVKDYLIIYSLIGAANSILTFVRAFLFAYGGIQAAKVLHERLLKAILRAPIPFFDTTPIGRIVNRFGSDISNIDDTLPFVLNRLCAQSFTTIGTIIITCYGIPWFTCILVPLIGFYYYTQRYYRHSSRELKRLGSVTLSPIYEHFLETLSGLMTIRAFKESHRFTSENETKLDFSQRANYSAMAAAQWLAIRLNMIAVAVVGSVAFLAVFEHHFNSVNPGLVGLAISYALSITFTLSNLINSVAESEKQMINVERVMQYVDETPQEEQGTDNAVNSCHFHEGRIRFENVYLKYREELPYALIDVSLHIKPGEKIGICGRTGSGKSSLFRLLFKIVNLTAGDIYIDDVDLKTANSRKLRTRMSIIPQDPFLFNDTVAINLDPQQQYTSFELLHVLDKCHLTKVVYDLGGLQGTVGERGMNLSTGQKQLMCLARALLKQSKVICIDEATASVDFQTDQLIQTTLREEFVQSTVLTVAHRMETIMDSDRVLVMDYGRVGEFSTPSELLANGDSLFYALVEESKKSQEKSKDK